jgi:hypothetical protein
VTERRLLEERAGYPVGRVEDDTTSASASKSSAAGRTHPPACAIIHATARGAALTWLSMPDDQRDPAFLTAMREAMVAAVTTDKPAVQSAGPAGAARALRAALPEQATLRGAEQHLLNKWLDRLTAHE